MSILDKIERIAAQLKEKSLDEILFRLVQKTRMIGDRFFLSTPPLQRCFVKGLPENLLSHMRKRRDISFFTRINGERAIPELQESDHKKIIEIADNAMKKQFYLLSMEISFENEIDWQKSFGTEKSWPDIYYSDVRFGKNLEHGDVKYIWELNRFQWLIELGKAYAVTGDEKYARAGIDFILDWTKKNRFCYGINWISALEVSIRMTSFIWTYFLLLDSDNMKKEINLKLLHTIYLHAFFIERHFSFYFSPYNHLVGEAGGLAIAGLLFPEFRHAKRWREKGWGILKSEITKQFHSDGGSVEQSIPYHQFVLGIYLQIVLCRKMNNLVIENDVMERLERALEFLMGITTPDTAMPYPVIGDNDDGQPVFVQKQFCAYGELLSVGAALFGRPDMKKSGRYSETTAWLLGNELSLIYNSLQSLGPLPEIEAFYKSGYFIMKNSSDMLIVECGEQADGISGGESPSAAHGHADALSVLLTAFGQQILIDPGNLSYNSEKEWADYFRQTRAHNCLSVDGLSQSRFHGRMKWSNCCKTRVIEFSSKYNNVSFTGLCRGFYSGESAITHTRSVMYVEKEFWLIHDLVVGKKDSNHAIEINFHLSPYVELKGNRIYTDNGCIHIETISDVTIGSYDTKGGATPGPGWVAFRYGKKMEATSIINSASSVRLPFSAATLIMPIRNLDDNISFSVFKAENGYIYEICRNKAGVLEEDHIFFSYGGTVDNIDFENEVSYKGKKVRSNGNPGLFLME